MVVVNGELGHNREGEPGEGRGEKVAKGGNKRRSRMSGN